jgi:hypothetical protein
MHMNKILFAVSVCCIAIVFCLTVQDQIDKAISLPSQLEESITQMNQDMRHIDARAEELAALMGIKEVHKVETEIGVPISINGIIVPPKLFTDAERATIESARRIRRLMNEPPPPAAPPMPQRPLKSGWKI